MDFPKCFQVQLKVGRYLHKYSFCLKYPKRPVSTIQYLRYVKITNNLFLNYTYTNILVFGKNLKIFFNWFSKTAASYKKHCTHNVISLTAILDLPTSNWSRRVRVIIYVIYIYYLIITILFLVGQLTSHEILQ